jgi:Ca2+-binding RTX toxin-like protein
MSTMAVDHSDWQNYLEMNFSVLLQSAAVTATELVLSITLSSGVEVTTDYPFVLTFSGDFTFTAADSLTGLGGTVTGITGTLDSIPQFALTGLNLPATEITEANLQDLPSLLEDALGDGAELTGASGNESLHGGAGDDTLDGAAGDDHLWGGVGIDHLLGGDGNDLLFGEIGNDILQGGAGNDTLDGGAGNDTMSGGLGNDTYVIDSLLDKADDVGGTDIELSDATHTLETNIENLVLTGTAAISGTGNSGNNRLTGNSGNNRLDGGAGNDTALGGAGADSLVGGMGNDSLNGGTGIDTLVGGAGKDTLTGGTDSKDVFDFNALNETGNTSATADTITDFKHLIDKIDLATIDANAGHAGNDAFGQLIASTASFSHAGQLQFKGGVLYGNTDSDSAAEFAIHLTGVTSVSLGDFVL